MPFQSALTSNQLETLRGTDDLPPSYEGSIYLSLCPNEVIYSARVNQASFADSFAQVTFDGGSGTRSDIRADMTVLFSQTNDMSKAYFVGRVRLDESGVVSTSTVLYINETSADIHDNDYIFVLDDFRIWDKLGRQVSGVLRHDYNILFRLLLPVVYNLQTVYVGQVDPDTGVFTQSFAPLAYAAQSGATIGTPTWEVGDGTITAGDTDEFNITVEFPEGHRWIHLTVPDSGGRSITRHIEIHAHGDTYQPQLLETGSLQVTDDVGSGWDATVSAFAGVDGILDNTLVTAWNADELYQDGSSGLGSSNIAFVGRIRKSSASNRADEAAGVDGEKQYTLEGPLTQLARIEQLPYEVLNKATPEAFGQVKNATLWRFITYLLTECSTFPNLHSLSFDDTSSIYLAPTRNPVGNILNAINDLAGSYNAAIQMNAAGEAEIVRDAVMLHYDKDAPDERDSLTTVAEWTDQDLTELRIEHSDVRTVGRLKASGGSYNSVSDSYNVFESLAPGVAQDYGDGATSLDRQVLPANQNAAQSKAVLNERAGHALEKAQEVETINVTFLDGYHAVLIAARNLWHTFTYDDDDRAIHIANTTRWLCTNVTITHNGETGTKDVQATFIKETFGAPGQFIPPENPATTPLDTPQLPPSDPYPAYPVDLGEITGDVPPLNGDPDPSTIPTNGNAVLTGTQGQVLVVVNPAISTTPGTRDVTPADILGTVRHAKLGAGKDCYCLSSNGDYSRLHYTDDVFAGDVIWVARDDVSGEYTIIRIGSTQGEIYIEGSSVGTITLDMTLADPGWDIQAGARTSRGQYTPGVGLEAINAASISNPNNISHELQATLDILEDVLTFVEIEYDYVIGAGFVFGGTGLYFGVSGSVAITAGLGQVSSWSGSETVSQFLILAFCGELTDGSDPGGTFILKRLTYSGSTGLQTRYSDDFGATVGSAKPVGDTASFNGIDTAKTAGDVILAAAVGQVQKAEAGGDYAAYGSALPTGAAVGALFIPRYQLTSTSVGNDEDDPEYIASLVAADGDDETLYRVTSGGNTFFGITPTSGGDPGTAVSPNCMVMPWRSGAIILGVFDFDGVRKLAVSINTGGSWIFSAALEDDALAVAVRKSDLNNKQAFIANGTSLGYCSNYRANPPVIQNRNVGVTDPLLFVEIYG